MRKNSSTARRNAAKKAKPSSRYRQPRIVQSWNAPMRAYVSCLATAAWDDGKRGSHLVEAVAEIVPKWRSFFDTPPTDVALMCRAHNSRCGPTSKTEAPEVNRHKKAIWPVAKRDYKARKFTFSEVAKKAA
ncbi:hypothetical protein [Bradyrhizobium sp. Pha-3]|uniref:hypothetical protein n=1 Tax=Bradyrhizobium TaxID=374 RepID=UPI0035D46F13